MSELEQELRKALEPVAATPPDEPLDAKRADDAVAAADIVAALAGETGAELPDRIRDWADAQTVDVGPLLPLARDAVVRVAAEGTDDEERRQFLITLERRLGTP